MDKKPQRLTARNEDGRVYYPECFKRCNGEPDGDICLVCDIEQKRAEKLARYEDLEEQGRLKETPSAPIEVVVKEESVKGVNTKRKYACPRCSKVLFIQNHIDFSGGDGFQRFPQGSQTKYCHNCGQHLEWGTIAKAALTEDER